MLTFEWDANAQRIIDNFFNVEAYWKEFLKDFSYELGEQSVKYMKPMTVGKSKFYTGGQNLANSLQFHSDLIASGFDVTFEGLFYGNYMDVGNFPPEAQIARASKKPFPVGASRSPAGEITFTRHIHGMGHYTPGVPTHFSEKTAFWLEQEMGSLADPFINDFFKKLVT